MGSTEEVQKSLCAKKAYILFLYFQGVFFSSGIILIFDVSVFSIKY